nr:copia protein [Tanacetum cinerariifolium]
MHQPPGFVDSRYPNYVCLLQRSLYGLKQVSRAWFQWFAGYATRAGLSPSRCDSSLFIYAQGSYVAYILIYVDDIILTASSPVLLRPIVNSLHKEFDMTDLGALNCFLGISVVRRPTGLFLSQKKYALQLLERAHMAKCNPSRTPVDTDSKLGPDGVPVQDPTLYHSLARGIQYLIFTRPDLSYAVQQVCLYMHDPKEPHFAALKRILRYVQGTLELDLHLYASSTTSLIGYTDADWAGSLLLAETAWIRNLLRELHSSLLTATLVYCDNVSAVYMSANPVQHQRTKHIEINIHFVCDMVKAGHVRVFHVPSRFQYADIFTKGIKTPLALPWERIPRLDSDVRVSTQHYFVKLIKMGRDIVQLETVVSTISQEYLLEFTSEYGISEDLHPKLPGLEERIVDFSKGKVPPPENVATTRVAPEAGLAEKIAAMGPRVIKERCKRGNNGVYTNGPPKVLRRDHAESQPTQSNSRLTLMRHLVLLLSRPPFVRHLVLGFSSLQVMPLGLVCLLVSSSPVLLQQIVNSLHKEFDMTDLGALNYFLGIFVIRHPTGLFLSQKKPLSRYSKGKNRTNGGRLNNKTKCLIKVNLELLCRSLITRGPIAAIFSARPASGATLVVATFSGGGTSGATVP